jgi:hypothetical protein
MSRFVKLTLFDGNPLFVWMAPGAAIFPDDKTDQTRLTSLDAEESEYFLVRESPEQILALLDAVDAPGTAEVTVTDGVVDRAWDAYANVRTGSQAAMRAAIEAADRARGLRP